jgi:hypothetical protein
VQLSSIRLLYVNAQPLHQVKIMRQNPKPRRMHSVLAFAIALKRKARVWLNLRFHGNIEITLIASLY